MLSNLKQRVNDFWEESRADIYLVIGIALIATLSFSAGRLSVSFSSKPPITVEEIPIQLVADTMRETSEDLGVVTASKRGKKYHLPDCPGAKQIAEKNRIWFATIQEAIQTGYQPAANCPGL